MRVFLLCLFSSFFIFLVFFLHFVFLAVVILYVVRQSAPRVCEAGEVEEKDN